MAELTSKEKLQPSLLDRLTDTEPTKSVESRQQRVLSMRQLRAAVLRDLEWLLNSGNMDGVQDLSDYPDVSDSVLNYGLPDLAGSTVSSADVNELERVLYDAIIHYEPRIIRNTLNVTAQINTDQLSHNAITFNIEGELWAQPIFEQLYLKTSIDLENGEVKVTENAGREKV